MLGSEEVEEVLSRAAGKLQAAQCDQREGGREEAGGVDVCLISATSHRSSLTQDMHLPLKASDKRSHKQRYIKIL